MNQAADTPAAPTPLDSRQVSEKDPIPNQDPSSETLTMETSPVQQQQPVPKSAGDDIPDGGLRAWLQVLSGWVILAANWGLVNSFGVYQTYYETTMLKDYSASSISWIGSLQACLLFLAGVAAGPLFDAGYSTLTINAGLFLIIFGMFMTSISTTYWQVLLAQGICTGLGMGLTFLPTTAIQAQYWRKKRAFALGIAGTGSPVAGIIFPIIFSKLLPKIGFGWATRVIAFILLGLSVIPVTFLRPRLPPPPRIRSMIDPTAWRDVPFLIFTLALVLVFLVLYTPFFYIQVYSEFNNVTSKQFAPYTVTLLNGGSIVGRLMLKAGDKVGALNVTIVCALASAVLIFGWMGIHSLGGIIVFALLYGMTSGAIVIGAPTVLMGLSPSMETMGTRLGMAFTVTGIAVLVGTPIAGAILGNFSRERWLGTMGFSAGGLLIGSVLMAVTWILLRKKKQTWKL